MSISSTPLSMAVSFAVWALVFPVSTQAALEFVERRASYKASPTEESFESVFEFTNKSAHPVVIHEVDSNCGCLRASSDKNRYAPGESGKVTAVFKIGTTEGVQTKSVTVIYAEEKAVVRPKVVGATESKPSGSAATTEAGEETPARATGRRERLQLMVEVEVPTLIAIEPKITKWPMGSEPTTKVVEISMQHESPILIREVRSSRENVRVELKEIEKGKRYQLELTPEKTDSVQLGMLTIETNCDIKRHQKKLAFFSIHRPTARDRVPAKPAPAVEAGS